MLLKTRGKDQRNQHNNKKESLIIHLKASNKPQRPTFVICFVGEFLRYIYIYAYVSQLKHALTFEIHLSAFLLSLSLLSPPS